MGKKPGFEAYADRKRSVLLRVQMTARNQAAAPAGFERTVATRAMPQLLGEIAAGQSLNEGRRLLKAKPEQRGLGRHFARPGGFFKGEKP